MSIWSRFSGVLSLNQLTSHVHAGELQAPLFLLITNRLFGSSASSTIPFCSPWRLLQSLIMQYYGVHMKLYVEHTKQLENGDNSLSTVFLVDESSSIPREVMLRAVSTSTFDLCLLALRIRFPQECERFLLKNPAKERNLWLPLVKRFQPSMKIKNLLHRDLDTPLKIAKVVPLVVTLRRLLHEVTLVRTISSTQVQLGTSPHIFFSHRTVSFNLNGNEYSLGTYRMYLDALKKGFDRKLYSSWIRHIHEGWAMYHDLTFFCKLKILMILTYGTSFHIVSVPGHETKRSPLSCSLYIVFSENGKEEKYLLSRRAACEKVRKLNALQEVCALYCLDILFPRDLWKFSALSSSMQDALQTTLEEGSLKYLTFTTPIFDVGGTRLMIQKGAIVSDPSVLRHQSPQGRPTLEPSLSILEYSFPGDKQRCADKAKTKKNETPPLRVYLDTFFDHIQNDNILSSVLHSISHRLVPIIKVDDSDDEILRGLFRIAYGENMLEINTVDHIVQIAKGTEWEHTSTSVSEVLAQYFPEWCDAIAIYNDAHYNEDEDFLSNKKSVTSKDTAIHPHQAFQSLNGANQNNQMLMLFRENVGSILPFSQHSSRLSRYRAEAKLRVGPLRESFSHDGLCVRLVSLKMKTVAICTLKSDVPALRTLLDCYEQLIPTEIVENQDSYCRQVVLGLQRQQEKDGFGGEDVLSAFYRVLSTLVLLEYGYSINISQSHSDKEVQWESSIFIYPFNNKSVSKDMFSSHIHQDRDSKGSIPSHDVSCKIFLAAAHSPKKKIALLSAYLMAIKRHFPRYVNYFKYLCQFVEKKQTSLDGAHTCTSLATLHRQLRSK